MRQVALDTETTGIGAEFGHRIIEIGCLELMNRKLTGRHFHVYLNPEREVDEGAFKVHGISTQFLQDKPIFKAIADEFLMFVDNAELIIHNAPFDIGFLNMELKRIQSVKMMHDYASVLDTLVLAKKKHPGQRNSLDALCKRYDVDNTSRQWHGALLDAELLAFVYLAMTGGQTHLLFDDVPKTSNEKERKVASAQNTLTSSSPILAVSTEERERHLAFVDFIVKKSGTNHWDEP